MKTTQWDKKRLFQCSFTNCKTTIIVIPDSTNYEMENDALMFCAFHAVNIRDDLQNYYLLKKNQVEEFV